MVGLQEFIHKLELGEGVKWVKWTAVTLMFIGLAMVYDMMLFRNLITEESMDQAQLARNLSEGKGYTTSYIRPFSVYLLQQHRSDRSSMVKEGHPDLANAPLYPVLLAAYMKAMPFHYEITEETKFHAFSPDVLIAAFNQLWFALALFFTYQIGKRLFGVGVAWFAMGILACTELFWRLTIWGGSNVLLVALVLGLIYCLVRMEEGTGEEKRSTAWFAGWAALAGLFLGLAALTRYSAICLIFPVVVYCFRYFGSQRKTVILTTTLCSGLLLSPWLVRNYQACGKLFGLAGYAVYEDSAKYSESAFQRQYKPDPIKFGQFSVEDALRKFVTNARRMLQEELPKMGGNWFSALFLAGLLMTSSKPAQGRMRVFLILMILTLFVAQALGRSHLGQGQPDVSSENLLSLAAPMIFVFGAGLCVRMIEQVQVGFPEMRILINAGIWAVFSLPLLLAAVPPRPTPICYPPYYPYIIRHAGGVFDDKDLIMSDMPWAMAWYGQRKSISTTLTIEDFIAINDEVKTINALYLTELTTDSRMLSKLLKGDDQVWFRLYLGITVKGTVDVHFPLKYVWTDIKMPSQLFVADLERWKMPAK
jgi:Ca2+/Na+ antiporter